MYSRRYLDLEVMVDHMAVKMTRYFGLAFLMGIVFTGIFYLTGYGYGQTFIQIAGRVYDVQDSPVVLLGFYTYAMAILKIFSGFISYVIDFITLEIGENVR